MRGMNSLMLTGLFLSTSVTSILFFLMSIQPTHFAYSEPPNSLDVISKGIADVRQQLNLTQGDLSVNDTELAGFHLNFADKQLQILQEYANSTSAMGLNSTLGQNNLSILTTLKPR